MQECCQLVESRSDTRLIKNSTTKCFIADGVTVSRLHRGKIGRNIEIPRLSAHRRSGGTAGALHPQSCFQDH